MCHRIIRLELDGPGNPLARAITLADFNERPGAELGRLGVIGMESQSPLRQFGAPAGEILGFLLST